MNAHVYAELLRKKEILSSIAETLKNEFIGLDKVIDEVCRLVLPWYMFPEAQLRPTVINLWGLTGTGKTALIHRLMELLDHKKSFIQLDMGEFESDSAGWVRHMFTDKLDHFDGKPVVICLDEFQFAKTIENGEELPKDKLRVIWELLDTGRIGYIPNSNSYYVRKAETCIRLLLKCMDKSVIVENGKVVHNVDEFKLVFGEFYFDNYTRYDVPIDHGYLVSNDFVEGMHELHDDNDLSKESVEKKLNTLDITGIVDYLMEGIRKCTAQRYVDLSKGLLFVVGNLDEAYWMSSNMNPDISADEFFNATSRLNISHIKAALGKRFRNEQIARLGNSHVIYPSFDNAGYKRFIERQVLRVRDYVKEKFLIEFTFDDSIIDLVYKEGVFPTQGTRPVLTTIKNVIESRIAKAVLEASGLEGVVNVEWKFTDGCLFYLFRNAGGNVVHTVMEKLELKVESLRQPANPDIQAHTAVHESGHAILAVLAFHILPSVVTSKTASGSCEGFCLVNLPQGISTRDTIRKEIIVALGGYVAEKMIFGEENTSTGVWGDIEAATVLANEAIREYAMGVDPVHLSLTGAGQPDSFIVKECHTEEALRLIRECLDEATAILERNKLLLLKMAEHLTYNSRMESGEIGEMVKKYSVEDWVKKEGFVKKDKYFSFSDTIRKQIEEIESAASMKVRVV
jgi:hypothetical protein